MPIYEYQCQTCGQHFDKLVRFGENDQGIECPACRSNETRKQLSTFASRGAGGSLSTASNSSCGSSASPFR